MKMTFSQAVAGLAAALALILPGLSSNSAAAALVPEPAFAIHTLAESVDQRILIRGTGDWSQVRLSPVPVISDADIMNYDFTTHTLRLTPEALARLPRPPVSGTPFVVTAEGEQIYLGVFTTWASSMSFAVPSIVADGRMSTNRSRMAVVIDRAYPTAQFGVGPDPRNDPRIRQGFAWVSAGLLQRPLMSSTVRFTSSCPPSGPTLALWTTAL